MNYKDQAIFKLAQDLLMCVRAAEVNGSDSDVILQSIWLMASIYQQGLKKEPMPDVAAAKQSIPGGIA